MLISSMIVRLARELTEGLAYLHERNIVASFLSPENILFNSEVILICNYIHVHVFVTIGTSEIV